MDDLLRHVGTNIRRLRKARKWTLKELGERAGLHQTFIGGVELGRRNPTLLTLGKIVRALGVPFPQLFEDLGEIQAVHERRAPYAPDSLDEALLKVAGRMSRPRKRLLIRLAEVVGREK